MENETISFLSSWESGEGVWDEPELVLGLVLPGGKLKGESLVTPAPYCSRSLPWKPGMAAHACNLSTWEAEARRIATNRKKLAWATE